MTYGAVSISTARVYFYGSSLGSINARRSYLLAAFVTANIALALAFVLTRFVEELKSR
ncbi:MAG: hypothetical protein ACLTSK_01000 [Christensenellales bacterium]